MLRPRGAGNFNHLYIVICPLYIPINGNLYLCFLTMSANSDDYIYQQTRNRQKIPRCTMEAQRGQMYA